MKKKFLFRSMMMATLAIGMAMGATSCSDDTDDDGNSTIKSEPTGKVTLTLPSVIKLKNTREYSKPMIVEYTYDEEGRMIEKKHIELENTGIPDPKKSMTEINKIGYDQQGRVIEKISEKYLEGMNFPPHEYKFRYSYVNPKKVLVLSINATPSNLMDTAMLDNNFNLIGITIEGQRSDHKAEYDSNHNLLKYETTVPVVQSSDPIHRRTFIDTYTYDNQKGIFSDCTTTPWILPQLGNISDRSTPPWILGHPVESATIYRLDRHAANNVVSITQLSHKGLETPITYKLDYSYEYNENGYPKTVKYIQTSKIDGYDEVILDDVTATIEYITIEVDKK